MVDIDKEATPGRCSSRDAGRNGLVEILKDTEMMLQFDMEDGWELVKRLK